MKIDVTLLLAFITMGTAAAAPDCSSRLTIVNGLLGTDDEFNEHRTCPITKEVMKYVALNLQNRVTTIQQMARFGMLLADGNCSKADYTELLNNGDLSEQYLGACFNKAVGDSYRADSARLARLSIPILSELAKFMEEIGQAGSEFDPSDNTLKTLAPHLLQYQAACGSNTPIWKKNASKLLYDAIDNRTPQVYRALLTMADASVKQIEMALSIIDDNDDKTAIGRSLIAMIAASAKDSTDESAVLRINAILDKIGGPAKRIENLEFASGGIDHFNSGAPPFAKHMLASIADPKHSISQDLSKVFSEKEEFGDLYSPSVSIQWSLIQASLNFHTDPSVTTLDEGVERFKNLGEKLNAMTGDARQTAADNGESDWESDSEELGDLLNEKFIEELLKRAGFTESLQQTFEQLDAPINAIGDAAKEFFTKKEETIKALVTPEQQQKHDEEIKILVQKLSEAKTAAVPPLIKFVQSGSATEAFKALETLYGFKDRLFRLAKKAFYSELDKKIATLSLGSCDAGCKAELAEPLEKMLAYVSDKVKEYYPKVIELRTNVENIAEANLGDTQIDKGQVEEGAHSESPEQALELPSVLFKMAMDLINKIIELGESFVKKDLPKFTAMLNNHEEYLAAKIELKKATTHYDTADSNDEESVAAAKAQVEEAKKKCDAVKRKYEGQDVNEGTEGNNESASDSDKGDVDNLTELMPVLSLQEPQSESAKPSIP